MFPCPRLWRMESWVMTKASRIVVYRYNTEYLLSILMVDPQLPRFSLNARAQKPALLLLLPEVPISLTSRPEIDLESVDRSRELL
jgi:hypothetical protein